MYQFIRTLTTAVMVTFLLISHCSAALPPLSPEELQNDAEAIVTGEAVSIEALKTRDHLFSSDYDWKIVITLRITSVSKSARFAEGEEIQIHCWKVGNRSDGWAGPSGHLGIPDQGAVAKFYLKKSQAGQWAPLQPNGIELVSGERLALPDDAGWFGHPAVLIGFFIGAIGVFGFVGAGLLRRQQK